MYAIVGHVSLDVKRPTTALPLALGSFADPLPTFPAEVSVSLSEQPSATAQFTTVLAKSGETASRDAFKEYFPYDLPQGPSLGFEGPFPWTLRRMPTADAARACARARTSIRAHI